MINLIIMAIAVVLALKSGSKKVIIFELICLAIVLVLTLMY